MSNEHQEQVADVSVAIGLSLPVNDEDDHQQQTSKSIQLFNSKKSNTNEILLGAAVEKCKTQQRLQHTNFFDTAFYILDNKQSPSVNIFGTNWTPPLPVVHSPINYNLGIPSCYTSALREPELHTPSSQQENGSKALSNLMFTDAAIVNHREFLEDIRGEDAASELCCRSWDFLEGIDLEWAIRNKSWFLPYFKERRVMFCEAFRNIFGELGNLGQQSKGTGMGAQMAFGTKTSINYQGSIPSDKMDEGNQSVLYMMRDMIFKAFRDGGTVSDEWTMDAAFKVAQAYITFFDWSLLCCEGGENDVNGTSWDTMKSQLKNRGGLMLWRMFAVINSGWYSIEYHIESGGKQFQLLEASSRTMELSHGRTTDEVLSNKLIQIFPLCHANAQEIWMSSRHIFSYERLLKLDKNLARYLQPLVGRTIPDRVDKLVLHQNGFNYFIKLAGLDGLFLHQIEEVYDLATILRTEKKAARLEFQDAKRSASHAIANGEESIGDLAIILASESKLIENRIGLNRLRAVQHPNIAAQKDLERNDMILRKEKAQAAEKEMNLWKKKAQAALEKERKKAQAAEEKLKLLNTKVLALEKEKREKVQAVEKEMNQWKKKAQELESFDWKERENIFKARENMLLERVKELTGGVSKKQRRVLPQPVHCPTQPSHRQKELTGRKKKTGKGGDNGQKKRRRATSRQQQQPVYCHPQPSHHQQPQMYQLQQPVFFQPQLSHHQQPQQLQTYQQQQPFYCHPQHRPAFYVDGLLVGPQKKVYAKVGVVMESHILSDLQALRGRWNGQHRVSREINGHLVEYG